MNNFHSPRDKKNWRQKLALLALEQDYNLYVCLMPYYFAIIKEKHSKILGILMNFNISYWIKILK